MTEPAGVIPISVLVRTFNSAKTLDQVLAGLKWLEGDECIIVDSGSTDSTLDVAVARGARIVHAQGAFNYSKSLNLGFDAAKNPWVLVLSSHSVSLVPDLLAVYREEVRKFPANVVVGYGPNALGKREPYLVRETHIFSEKDFPKMVGLCGNGNALYRRSAWQEVSFDETIRTAEDRAWVTAILKKGLNYALVPKARTINLTQYSLRYMYRKGYSDARSAPHEPQSLFDLALGLGSLTKRLFGGRVTVGNWMRRGALCVGAYFGSQQEYDNTPGN